MKKLIWIKHFAISLCIVGCTADGEFNNKETGDRVLPVIQLTTKDTMLHKDYVTDIHAVQNVEIRARIPGFLEQIYVDEGQQVKKGQPLFRINDDEYETEMAKAKANLKNAIAEARTAELEVERVKLLVDKKVIAKTELQLAEAKLAAAQAKIDEARSSETNAALRLSYTYIKSPFDGIIDRIPLKVGSLIEEGTLLTTVFDVHDIYAYFDVSEIEYLNYAKLLREDAASRNSIVQLTLADGSPYPHPGKIETMEGEFEASTGSIAFRARFPNPDRILKHGSTGKVRLTNDVSDALMLPQKAVFEIQDKNFVFVVDTNNIVKMKSFTPKTRVSHFYIVESGLEPGERVIYEGVQSLREGMAIEPQYVAMDSLLTMKQ